MKRRILKGRIQGQGPLLYGIQDVATVSQSPRNQHYCLYDTAFSINLLDPCTFAFSGGTYFAFATPTPLASHYSHTPTRHSLQHPRSRANCSQQYSMAISTDWSCHNAQWGRLELSSEQFCILKRGMRPQIVGFGPKILKGETQNDSLISSFFFVL